MKRPVKIALIVLSILFVALLALNIWQYLSGEADMARWVEEAADLRAQVLVHREARDAAEAAAAVDKAYMVEAEIGQFEKEREVAQLKKILRNRPPVPPEARVHTDIRDDIIEAQGEELDLTKAGLAACKASLSHTEDALGESKMSDNLNEEQAVGWKDFSKKQRRRYRMKTGFTAIGSAAVVGSTMYFVGRASR